MIFFIYSAMYALQIGSSGAMRCNDVNAVDNCRTMAYELGVTVSTAWLVLRLGHARLHTTLVRPSISGGCRMKHRGIKHDVGPRFAF